MNKNMICIICPRGCSLQIKIDGEHIQVSGNACPKGHEYAVNECTNPVRTVTATIRVSNRENTMVSVKTAVPVSKANMMEVMNVLRGTSVQAPVSIGDIVLSNVCGSDIVVTKEVK